MGVQKERLTIPKCLWPINILLIVWLSEVLQILKLKNRKKMCQKLVLINLHRFFRLPPKVKQHLFHFVSFTEQVFDT
ncbi:hypothetical protein BpHYR1_036115 [Brachionus plicatilis]|uniref:Uncharacterized protein n=1 Tax=Brachionus plicatilis TaxID=10195 RepID=A0A3M7S5S9_BRAPC|nr:hypothetical protein BpHYR1_036115 [Brachionus plicatilis]